MNQLFYMEVLNMKQQIEKCRCTRCTYNNYIKMRLTKDGFLKAICPRCETEYIRVVKEK